MSLAVAVGQIWICGRTYIMVRHVQVKSGLASARYLVELVLSFLKVMREDLRGNEELSDVAAF